MKFLSGYKTYIVVVIGVLVNGLVAQGIIGAENIELINTLLTFLGLGTIRNGIK